MRYVVMITSGSDSDCEDALSAASQSQKTSNKRKPPSYTQPPAKGTLKKPKLSAVSSSSGSQVISQLLAPVAGSTETTGRDLTRMLSQPSQQVGVEGGMELSERRECCVFPVRHCCYCFCCYWYKSLKYCVASSCVVNE